MDNFGLISYAGGNHLPAPVENYHPIDSFMKSLMSLFHAGKVIEAEERIRIAMVNAKAQERRMIIESLTQIAANTKDDAIRQQMFYSIWQLGCTWQ